MPYKIINPINKAEKPRPRKAKYAYIYYKDLSYLVIYTYRLNVIWSISYFQHD